MTLLVHLPLDEDSGDAIDYSGYENDCSVSGATQGASGLLNTTAYEFNGSGDIVSRSNNSATDQPQNTNEVTVAAWVRPNYTNMDSRGTVCTRNGMYYMQVKSDGLVSVYTYNNSGGGSSYMDANTSLPEDQWSYIVFTETGGNRTIYIDGKVDSTGSFTAQIGTDDNNGFGIGDQTSGGGRAFDGRISNVRVYSRALSHAEVQYLYQTTQSATFTTPTVTLQEAPSQVATNTTVPSGTSIDVTVENASGVSETASIGDGETTVGLSNFSNADDYWLSAELSTTNINAAASIDYIALATPSSNAFVYDGSSWNRTNSINVFDGSSWNGISQITEL